MFNILRIAFASIFVLIIFTNTYTLLPLFEYDVKQDSSQILNYRMRLQNNLCILAMNYL